MEQTILTTLSHEEFKTLLKQTLQEILQGKIGKTEDQPEILDVHQASEFLHLKVNTLYEKTSRRQIPHFKKGNKLYFNKIELQEWVNQGKVKTYRETESDAFNYLMQGNKPLNKKAA